MTRLGRGDVEVYNEFSLQHELGIHLRNALPESKVQFERNVSHFSFAKAGLEKREIDIVVLGRTKGTLEAAIELKNPRNGQTPEAMFSFCKDIAFLEQLCEAGFGSGHFIALVDDPAFYSGKTNGIYGYFRDDIPIMGLIEKPTGSQSASLSIRGKYFARWQTLRGPERYCHIPINRL